MRKAAANASHAPNTSGATAQPATSHRAARSCASSRNRATSLIAILALTLCAAAFTAAPASADQAQPTMGAIEDPSYTTVHLTGEVGPSDRTTYYYFEYSTDQVSWFAGPQAFTRTLEPSATGTPVEEDLAGLQPATEYFIRLTTYDEVDNTEIHSAEPNLSFDTLAVQAPSVISIDDASDLSYSTATATGKIERPGPDDPAFYANCTVEYISDGLYEENINLKSLSGFEGAAPAPCDAPNPVQAPGESLVTAHITGLAIATTYHLRLTAFNLGGSDSMVAADTFTTLSSPPAPTVSIDPVATFTDATAHLSGKVNPNGIDPALSSAWHFQCLPACGEPGGIVPAGPEQAVSADLSGFEPNTTYQVKLIASNAGGPGEASTTFKTSALSPTVQTGYATEVEATSATIAAKLNPHNSEVSYQFEYGTDESYGTAIPVPAASLAEVDNTLHTVTRPLTGLQEDTTYHFRLTATNTEPGGKTTHGVDHTFTTLTASGPKPCPNQQLRAENSSLALPDCRAYEMVSPLQKSGNNAALSVGPSGESQGGYAQATPDGNGVVYWTQGSVGEANSGLSNYSTSRRHDDGWSTRSAIPSGDREKKEAGPFSVQWPTFSPQLDRVVWGSTGAFLAEMPESPASHLPSEFVSGVYRGSPDGPLEWLNRPQLPDPVIGEYTRILLGVSPGLDTVYFGLLGTAFTEHRGPQLLPGEGPRFSREAGELFEYSSDGLRSAGILPDGSQPPGGSAPANLTSPGFNAAFYSSANTARGQVSRDGSTLYFISPDRVLNEPTELYVRRGGQSTLVSHDEAGHPAPSGAAPVESGFRGPTGGYQYVFGSPDGSMAIFQSRDALVNGAPDDDSLKAYRYDVATNTVSYLPGVGGTTIVASSDDGARFLMFHADTVLGNQPISLWDHGQITQFATVGQVSGVGTGNVIPARATPTGSAFVFLARGVPGFNTGGDSGNGGDYQVFRYDVAQEQLSCLSCPSDDIVPVGSASLGTKGGGGMVPNQVMSEDANRVFFDSPDALVPQDTNEARDVYEWTPSGVSLISTGHSKAASYILTNSPSGDDVFFSTQDGIDPADTDGLYDVYDARVDGGFPQTDAVTPCDNNAVCHGTPPPEPIRPAVGSDDQRADTPKFTISGGSLSSAKLKFIITAPAAATVDASGRGLRSTHRAISKPGRFKLLIPLKRGAINALTRGHRLALTVHLHFSPATGGPSSADRVLTVKG